MEMECHEFWKTKAVEMKLSNAKTSQAHYNTGYFSSPKFLRGGVKK